MMVLKELSQILGLFQQPAAKPDAGSDALDRVRCSSLLVDLRARLRKEKNFALADEIRKRLDGAGRDPRRPARRHAVENRAAGDSPGREIRIRDGRSASHGWPYRLCESEPDHEPRQESERLVPVPAASLGIDPGLNVTGYAVVEPSPRGPFVVEAGVIRPSAQPRGDGPAAGVYSPGRSSRSSKTFPPGLVALEQVHSHVKHPRTAILMAHARGVIVLAAAAAGHAGFRLRRDADQEDADRQRPGPQATDPARDHDRAWARRLPEPHDVADACALALCHFHVSRNTRLLAGL